VKTTNNHELLRAYAQEHSESAFEELVNRYVALVYSAAIRRVSGDRQLAEDVTQEVFTDLARKAAALPPTVMLGGWLHRHSGYVASTAMRGEQRRRDRERKAVEMNALNDPSEADWRQFAPVLDEAMDEMDAADRDALVLRYFERCELRTVGVALGVSDDTAQKRVSRALEKLRALLKHRGATLSAAALGTALASEAVTAAPAGLAATISAVALAGTTLATAATATAAKAIATTKAIAMTTLHKAVIFTVFAATVGTAIYQARQAANARADVQTLQQQQAPLTEQIQQLRGERDDATNRLVSLAHEKDSNTELLRLRGEVTRLRTEAQERARLKTEDAGKAAKSGVEEAESLIERVRLLKQRLAQTPEARIPELQFLSEEDWLRVAARPKQLDTDEDFRAAFSDLRNRAEGDFLRTMEPALLKYIEANNNQFPADLSQLKPYVEKAPGDDILQRYQIVPASSVPEAGGIIAGAGDWLITLKAPIDGKLALGRSGVSELNDSSGTIAILAPAMRALAEDTPEVNGKKTMDMHQLAPYLKTPEQKAAYQKLMQQSK
jgi:RNA polymerase sigma factor (sigma-70 family)